MSGQTLDFVDSFYLSFRLDSEISLKPLLSNVKQKITSKIKTMHKIRRYIDNNSAIAIYKQMVLPLFDYCSFLLFCKTDREDLQVIQNNALRLYLGIEINDRISLLDIHNRVNLVSLERRRCIQLLSLLFVHGKSNENVFEIPPRNTRAATVRKYRTQISRNSKYKNSPYCEAAKLWDLLPRTIRDSTTTTDKMYFLNSNDFFHK